MDRSHLVTAVKSSVATFLVVAISIVAFGQGTDQTTDSRTQKASRFTDDHERLLSMSKELSKLKKDLQTTKSDIDTLRTEGAHMHAGWHRGFGSFNSLKRFDDNTVALEYYSK